MAPLFSDEEGSPPPLPSRRQHTPPKPPKLPQRRHQTEEEAPPLPRRNQSPFEVNLVAPIARKREAPMKPRAPKPTLNVEKRPQFGARETKVASIESQSRTKEPSGAESTKKTFNNTSFESQLATKYKSFLDLEQQIKAGQRIGGSTTRTSKPTPPKKPAKVATEQKEVPEKEPEPKEQEPSDPKKPIKGPGFIAVSFTRESIPHKPKVGPKPEIKATSPKSKITEKPPKPKPRIGTKPPLQNETSTAEKGPGFVVMPFTKAPAPSNQGRPLKPQPLASKSQSLAPQTPPKPPKPASPSRSISNGAEAPPNTEAIGAISKLKPTKPMSSTKPFTANENKSSDSINSKSSLSFTDQLSTLLKTNTLPSLSAAEKQRPPQRSTTLPATTTPAKITHANKTRAKGPKRRLPGKASSRSSNGSTHLSSTQESTLLQISPSVKNPPQVVKKTPPPINKASKPKVAPKPDSIVVYN